MKVALIQSDLYWEDIAANLSHFEEQIWKIDTAVDLIVLPEMFNTGFSMHPERWAEPMNLTTFKWLKQMANQTNAALTGSYMVKENGHYFNRLVWMQPDGSFQTYDKRHLFSYAGEDQVFTRGEQKLIVEWRGWRVCPMICYDLRFPVWSRHTPSAPYDLLIYVANWPQRRAIAWNTLLKARAIENVSYVVGVNRIGTDGTGLYHAGDSATYDFLGNTLVHATDTAEILYAQLDLGSLKEFRNAFTALQDSDRFELL